MTGDLTLTLPPALLAPAQARSWVSDHAGDVSPQALQDALLVVSELVTNAVRHGRPDIVVSLRRTSTGLRVGVRDAGAAMPRPTRSAPPDVPSGRGLLIVEATAARWGITEDDPGPGKTVWAEVDGFPDSH